MKDNNSKMFCPTCGREMIDEEAELGECLICLEYKSELDDIDYDEFCEYEIEPLSDKTYTV